MTEQTDIEDAVSRVKEWCEFGDGRAYLLMGFARKKYNEERSSSDERVYRKVITDEESAEFQTKDLIAQMGRHDLHWRIYLTVNARDVLSAYTSFTQQLIGWSEELINGHEPAEEKILRLGSEWRSCLHKPEHKDDSYFQIDLDDASEKELEALLQSIEYQTQADTREVVQTPNGYHVMTTPFNYPNWQCPVEYDDLDTDGMVFVAEIDHR